ncbi:g5869 [Coccomyxa viridis]|uniref:G5869 protein n=1 Tax=Coccomyxa viridis TaxID=1274662 RepID=A0ABP1FXW0_9CHLO
MGGVAKKKPGSGNSRRRNTYKAQQRKVFQSRHIDQVWEDVRKDQEALITVSDTNKDKLGPIGTTDKAVLDEDTPGGGAHYCISCSRYFVTGDALEKHAKTKPHKRRLKELQGAKPHNKRDAEWAAGMGKPDNGAKQQPAQMEQ